jgi:hypothetical protein
MAHNQPRWRFRISTLMLLVVIMALSLALAIERRQRAELERRLEELAFRETVREDVLVWKVQAAPVVLHLEPRIEASQVEALFGSKGASPEPPGRTSEKLRQK